jgi:hypothetical protein
MRLFWALAPFVAAAQEFGNYQPGIILTLDTDYFNINIDILVKSMVEYLNTQSGTWTTIDFDFAKVSLSQLRFIDY